MSCLVVAKCLQFTMIGGGGGGWGAAAQFKVKKLWFCVGGRYCMVYVDDVNWPL